MIELRHLRYFRAVAEEQNFHRAAERIPVDLSALSRAVRELEEHVGVELLVRSPAGTRITPAGARMLDEVRGVFDAIEQAVRAAREVDGRERLPLRIGIADGLIQPMLSQCLAQWREAVPEIGLELTELRALLMAEALRREEIDVGFTFGLCRAEGLVQEPAWSYSLLVLMPAGHELADRPSLALSDVIGEPLIVCDPDYKPGVHHQVDRLLRQAAGDAVLDIAGKAGSLASFLTQIGAGYGIGLVDVGHMQTMARPDLAMVPLADPEAELVTHMLWKPPRDGQPLHASVRRFVEHVRAMRDASATAAP